LHKQRTRGEQIDGAKGWGNGEQCLKNEGLRIEGCVAPKRLKIGTKTRE